MTLEIKSHTPKSNQSIWGHKCIISWSFIKIGNEFRAVSCTQELRIVTHGWSKSPSVLHWQIYKVLYTCLLARFAPVCDQVCVCVSASRERVHRCCILCGCMAIASLCHGISLKVGIVPHEGPVSHFTVLYNVCCQHTTHFHKTIITQGSIYVRHINWQCAWLWENGQKKRII